MTVPIYRYKALRMTNSCCKLLGFFSLLASRKSKMRTYLRTWLILFFFLFGGNFTPLFGQSQLSIARLKYSGGGDWYSSKTALPNLIKFCNRELGTSFQAQERIVEIGSDAIFQYPFCFLTGHGNVVFSEQETNNLRTYLQSGGFLHICDNYGLNDYIRREMKKVFPESEWLEIPYNHPIYQQRFSFPQGVPKIHDHDGKRAQGFGLFHKGRLVCFYDYESDLGNGWEDAEVYNDPESLRLQALRMGANLVQFALTSPK
jgi:hypothetical protein